MNNDVRTTTLHTPRPSPRARSGPAFDPHWWGRAPQPGVVGPSYWSLTRGPLPSLAFLLPLLMAYEGGIVWFGGGSAEAARTGADLWIRQGLAALGMTGRWLPPMVLVGGLLLWQAVGRRDWRFGPSCVVGMAVEALVWAVALIGMSKLVDLGFARLEGQTVLAAPTESTHSAVQVIGYLGAGIYEEALFRLALIPLVFGLLRLLQTPEVVAGTVAVTGSALLFSIAHHAGVPGEAFTWYAFIFRWLAGVYFAWVFIVRGFGVAVGAHALYDILVGWLGWHF